jgi:regulator of cell morphogenesis and NO signaling
MNLTTRPLREIASEYAAAAQIFERFEIDLCAMGDATLIETCARLNLSVDQLQEKLGAVVNPGESSNIESSLSLTQLIQHIVRQYHRRIRQDLPALMRTAETLAEKHAEERLSFAQVARLITQLHSDLLEHIGREENVLFPFIARMEQEERVEYPSGHACFRSLSHPVAKMKLNHDAAAEVMEELRRKTNDFEASYDKCARHRALIIGLHGFAEDLGRHTQLEEEILFPRALSLEAALLEGSPA